MSTVEDQVLHWTEEHIDALVAAPPMWGSNEAVEMQALLLFELKALLLRPEESAKDPSRIFDTYTRFLRERFPRLPPAPLCELEAAPFAETLKEFHRLLSSRLEPENPFQHSDATAAPFDQTAEIRGIDLDRGTIALGRRPRVTCYVPADILGTNVREVGVSARVRGQYYAPALSPPFVIAESVDVLGGEPADG